MLLNGSPIKSEHGQGYLYQRSKGEMRNEDIRNDRQGLLMLHNIAKRTGDDDLTS